MFLGEFSHTIDDKGRLTLPAKFRAEFAGGIVVTRGIDKCLFAFPLSEWQTLAQRVSGLPLTEPQAREFQRLLFSGASDDVPDKQGRVLIPQYLREYATLDGEVIIAGLNTHVEIWNVDAWNEARKGFESGALDAEHWAKLGI
ncbi:MAG TPA: division/cell wall cluster transcriptional repressor MraZ [Anaerolineae bacterium]